MGLLRRGFGALTAAVPALAASQGKFGVAIRGLQTGLAITGALKSPPGGAGGAAGFIGTPPLRMAEGGGSLPVSTRGFAATPARIITLILAAAAQRLGIPRLTLQMAMRVLRGMGIAAGGSALTLALNEAVSVWMHGSKQRTRRKGVSARDVAGVRKATRTMRRVATIQRNWATACAPSARARARRSGHRAGCGCVVCVKR